MPIQKLLKVEFRWNGPSAQQCSTSFHLVRDTHPTPVQMNAISAFFATAGAGTLRNSFLALLTGNELLREIVVAEVPLPSDPNELYYLSTSSVNAAGTAATGDGKLPNEACATITLQSGFNSRRSRGRMFLPVGQDAAVLAGENFNSSHAVWTALGTFVTTLATLQANAAVHMVAPVLDSDLTVYSKVAQLEDPTIAGYEVVSIRRNAKVHWRRSRAT